MFFICGHSQIYRQTPSDIKIIKRIYLIVPQRYQEKNIRNWKGLNAETGLYALRGGLAVIGGYMLAG
jgi:hypothetical protein